MNDIERQIRDRVEAFASELTDLIRQSALDSFSEALGGGEAPVGVARQRGGARPPRPRLRRRGGKRSPEEIEATTHRVLEYVEQNPGRGVEQMAVDLSTSTKDLTLPVKKLLSHGDLLTEGQKRATKYYLASAGGAAGGNGADAPRRRRATKGKSRAKKSGRSKRG